MKLFSSLYLLATLCLTHAHPNPEVSSNILNRQTANKNLTDYAYVYFTGEGLATGEQVYMAVSNNNDPASWTALKNGNVYLTSNVGTKGIRDPSLIVAPDRSKFWIICTDLKVYGLAGGWNNADMTTKGSKSIVVWESTDLKSWSGPRLAKVSPDNAGMTWAPDAIWDPSTSRFMVFWTSNIQGAGGGWKTMRSFTKDFQTFTTAEAYVSLGMDNTIAAFSGKFYMLSKNGPGNLLQENVASSLNGPWSKVSENIGQGAMTAGEGPLVFQNNLNPNKWHLWIDDYTKGSGYLPFETTNLPGGSWTKSQNYKLPKNPRHGYVVPITAAERAALAS
ncbi:glycosyl hydrolase [Podospora appendiculata]|uniref:Glycosyl hydrolase n=1 Tax=Podospora appendiculata TaxID=314037 RepID=A0AAE0X8H0_9PEZI|nr:glycosyl hydrolase [Podospora appendiculata]